MADNSNDDDKTRTHIVLTEGTEVAHYRIIDKIGAGGMGEVYLAEDTKLNRKVALKFLPPHLCQNEDCRARFKREAQAAAKLDHPNIVTIHDVGEHENRPYFVMQYVEGQSLHDLIRSEKPGLERAIQLTLQVCEGLEKAHHLDIIHRDIKPSNIVIDADGRPKILDFGLAAVKGTDDLTKTGSRLGTIGYMSPEQVQGEKADQRSDIFSVTAVFYELVTGRPPFKKDSDVATMNAILNDRHEPTSRFNPDTSPEIEHIIEKGLQKNRNRRYESIDELITDFKRLLPETTGRRFYRSKLSARSIGVIVLLIIGMALILNTASRRAIMRFIGLQASSVEKHLVVLPFTNVSEDENNQPFCDGLLETVTSKLSQLELFGGALRVVPSSEVRKVGIVSARDAKKAFGVTHAVTGSVQRFGDSVRIIVNLIDARAERQLDARVIDSSITHASSLQDLVAIRIAEVLEIQLHPEEKRRLAAGGTEVSEAYDLYVRARGYFFNPRKEGNIDTAISLFQAAIDKDGDYALAYAGLGDACWRKYRESNDDQWIEPAIDNCRRAIRLDPRLSGVHVTLGNIYRGRGRYEESIQAYQRAIGQDPTSHAAYRGLGQSWQALNQPDEAEDNYARAVQLQPDYWDGYYSLLLFYIDQGRYDDALKRLDTAVALEPQGFDAWNNLGALYFFLDRCPEAREMWERSLAIMPNYGAYSNLGTLHYMDKQYSNAAQMYEKALELDSLDYQVWGNLASSYGMIPGSHDSAEAIYQRTIRMAEEQRNVNPRDVRLLSNLGEYYAAIHDSGRARQLSGQALARSQDDIDIIVRVGTVYEQLGLRDTAVALIGRALKAGYPYTYIQQLPELEQLLKDSRIESLLQSVVDSI